MLKIPWKNLYSLPVVADVEDLYLLVAPNAAVPYDAEKQEKADWEAKKGELDKFDEAKKREQDKDKPKADKSFTEKLVAQIINNVQIHIKNVSKPWVPCLLRKNTVRFLHIFRSTSVTKIVLHRRYHFRWESHWERWKFIRQTLIGKRRFCQKH